MSTLVPGMLIIIAMLLSSALLFSSLLSSSASQGGAMRDLAQSRQAQVRSSIDITSASVVTTGATSTDVRVLVDNLGAQSVADFNLLDVIVQYTDPTDNPVRTYLDFNTSGLGDNLWTNPAAGITPDSFNPRMWDPDEVFTIDLRVVPAIKTGTSAVVVVATPQAASDQTTVPN